METADQPQVTVSTLKRKCLHFDEIFITGCTESCQNDNFQCSQWWKFHQNDDIFVSVYTVFQWLSPQYWLFLYLLLQCWYWKQNMNQEPAPVPLSIFRSNSKFDENSERSSFEYTRPITTIFCTRHDSDTVVTCAKYRCDRPRIFYTRVFWIFIEFRIRSKYA